jgi:hypothetical protein
MFDLVLDTYARIDGHLKELWTWARASGTIADAPTC